MPKYVEPSVEILFALTEDEMLRRIEEIGRTCYQSHDRITDGSAEKFVRMIIERGHLGLLEHVSMTVRFTCSRGVADELMRHRHASFACMSTRYVNFSKKPLEYVHFGVPGDNCIYESLALTFLDIAYREYEDLIDNGCKPEIARNVLPLGIKTELCATANMREWRYILDLRMKPDCHPEMQYLMRDLLRQCKDRFPVLFDDFDDSEMPVE